MHIHRFGAFGSVVLVGLTACTEMREPTRSPRAGGRGATGVPMLTPSTTAAPVWLPVGTTVPPGEANSAPPEPYDPAKHGPALPQPTNEVNLARRPGFVPPPKGPPTDTGAPPPGDGNRGFTWDQISAPWYGAYSVYDLQLSLALDPAFPGRDGAWVYAPTMRAPGHACIEMAQVYQRLAAEDTTGKFFGLWDWCGSPPHGSWAVFESVDETFMNRYVRPYQGRNTYAITVVTPNTGHTSGQCWSANIYNYEVGGWVERRQSCGTGYPGVGTAGWTMWQSWYVARDHECPTLPSIRALDIALADPGSSTFDPFTNHPADYSSWGPRGGCWKSEIYTFESPVPGLADNTWRANTPNP